jgi:hypothetical protein
MRTLFDLHVGQLGGEVVPVIDEALELSIVVVAIR